jgi:hypothetical protein
MAASSTTLPRTTLTRSAPRPRDLALVDEVQRRVVQWQGLDQQVALDQRHVERCALDTARHRGDPVRPQQAAAEAAQPFGDGPADAAHAEHRHRAAGETAPVQHGARAAIPAWQGNAAPTPTGACRTVTADSRARRILRVTSFRTARHDTTEPP